MSGDRDKLYEYRYKYLYASAEYVHFVTRSWRPTYAGGRVIKGSTCSSICTDRRKIIYFNILNNHYTLTKRKTNSMHCRTNTVNNTIVDKIKNMIRDALSANI